MTLSTLGRWWENVGKWWENVRFIVHCPWDRNSSLQP
jgi:hypothetical protein